MTSIGETSGRQRARLVAALDVRAEAAVVGHDRLRRSSGCVPSSRGSDSSLSATSSVDVLGLHALEQRGVLRLLFVFRRAALHVRAEAADLQEHRLVRVGANAQRLFALRGLAPASPAPLSSVSSSGGMSSRQAGPAFALLQERPVAADAHEDRLAALGRADEDAADVAGVDLLDLVRQLLLQPGLPLPK